MTTAEIVTSSLFEGVVAGVAAGLSAYLVDRSTPSAALTTLGFTAGAIGCAANTVRWVTRDATGLVYVFAHEPVAGFAPLQVVSTVLMTLAARRILPARDGELHVMMLLAVCSFLISKGIIALLSQLADKVELMRLTKRSPADA